jgi:Domain of unknown function (DUF4411)
MPYVLDTNVFLQAKNLHYGFNFCPGFWDVPDDAEYAYYDMGRPRILWSCRCSCCTG